MSKAGTPWVLKTPRLKCRCGSTIHMEMRGKWRIIYDSEPHSPTPTSTLSTPYESEPPPTAEDDSDG